MHIPTLAFYRRHSQGAKSAPQRRLSGVWRQTRIPTIRVDSFALASDSGDLFQPALRAGTRRARRNPRLRHFKQRAPNPVSASDTDLVICQALDRQVLSKLAILKVISFEVGLPVSAPIDTQYPVAHPH
jgi:hypothetical protein